MTFRGKRVLVTGADGFIGSHLVECLVAEGATVRALTHYNAMNDWGWLEDINCLDAVEVVPGDVRDPHACDRLVRDVDVVFHLAALIAIPYSYQSPESYIQTNIVGTYNICHAALKAGVERFVQMSSSEVYGSAEYVPIDERHPLKPQSPYSASKIAADAMAASFYYSFDLPVTIARPFNTFGPRQSARAVIPTIMAQLALGLREVSLGDVSTTRDFTYVVDTCRGLMAIASLEAAAEVFNIGSNEEISIADLFALINEILGMDAVLRTSAERLRPRRSEVLRLRCDNAKLCAATSFRPSVSLQDGLRRTASWLMDPRHLDRYKGRVYSV